MKFFISIIILLFSSNLFAQKATFIYKNGNIITNKAKGDRAESMAIAGNKIIAIGSFKETKRYASKTTNIFDLGGKTIVPGFNDAHLHPRPIYPFESVNGVVDLSPNSVKNNAELVALLKRKAELTPEGIIIRGVGYQDTKLGGHPTRFILDQATTKHPIIISHSSGHVSAVNSFALNLAGINKNTVDPAGGAFDRDENGEPNGVCRESANLGRSIKPAPKPTESEELNAYKMCLNEYIAKGITSITEAGSNFEKLEIYKKLQDQGMPIRINLLMIENVLDQVIAKGIKQGYGDENLRISGIKTFHGNSLSGRTCWLNEPYDRINPKTGLKDDYGIPPKRSQNELDSLFVKIHDNGLQIACHSNGDREIEMVLTAVEHAQKAYTRDNHRHRIEHCSVTNDGILQRLLANEMIAVPHSYIYEHGDKMIEYGKNRWPKMHPNRSFIDMGINVAQHSDSPVSVADPMIRIQSLCTRTSAEGIEIGIEQRIDAEEAIKLWTSGGAYASFEEKLKGTLEKGKLADFVVLSADPTKTDIFKIKDIKVLETIINGKVVYENKN